ncbi:hypothetical protein HHSLTHF2_09440 [Vreelandella venusta]|uniref:Uncharacterized protein n=1 Tax=Halomonas hydrothermalis TaxID=115561 RepID=A0A6F8U1I1_9GAMM|nr:hypothetical protein HHSLTHF2_09440 [Halomonas hydrothermalis]
MQRSILYQGLNLFYANYFTKVVINTPMLVINRGSFSLDYALIDSDPQEPGTMMPKREEVNNLFPKLPWSTLPPFTSS